MSALTPRDALADGPTRTLVALIEVYRRDGRATVRSVAAEVGRSISTVHGHLLGSAPAPSSTEGSALSRRRHRWARR